MRVEAQTLSVECRGFWSSELVITSALGDEVRVVKHEIHTGDGPPHRIGIRGHCRRVHTLRTPAGRLVATAVPTHGCRHGYEVALQGGLRLTVERRRESFWRYPAVVCRGDETWLRFTSEGRLFSRAWRVDQEVPIALVLAAFLVYLHQRLLEEEAAAGGAAA
ncbi:hypothetical protein ACFL59_08380 [Planctomycetota bacterium]